MCRVKSPNIFFSVTGNGCDGSQFFEFSCCSFYNKCGENEGDCDFDSDCIGNLKCGTNNCVGSKFHSLSDCCYQ